MAPIKSSSPASTGVGAALIRLLFVSVSLATERAVQAAAPWNAARAAAVPDEAVETQAAAPVATGGAVAATVAAPK
jgi:hypothetical protein